MGPLLFTTIIWGDQPAEKVVIYCPDTLGCSPSRYPRLNTQNFPGKLTCFLEIKKTRENLPHPTVDGRNPKQTPGMYETL